MTTYDPGTQAERRTIIKEEARMKRHPSQEPPTPDTYFNRAQRQEPDQAKPSLAIPRLPASSPWSGDPVPDEPLIDGTGEGLRFGVPIDKV